MIPFEELDRALARWKARAQGGVVDVRTAPADSDVIEATPLPLSPEELGSIPNAIAPPATEPTGEIDASELEAYEDRDDDSRRN
jgi:hypothetical protein